MVWRLITNFFFLGKFSINFGIHLLMIARYGVQLEKGPFERRTADFLRMMIFAPFSLLVLSAIPLLWSPFLGISSVFMLLYVWSREFPNAQINIYGLVALKVWTSLVALAMELRHKLVAWLRLGAKANAPVQPRSGKCGFQREELQARWMIL